jgi:GT2 family glycosyltransferase
VDVAARCLVAVWTTARDAAEFVVVGQAGGDPTITAQLHAACDELGFGFGLTDPRTSLAAGVNPALEEALADGRDAVIVAPDVEPGEGWLEALLARRDSAGAAPAAIVGGRLLYPNGLIEHAGLQFSLLKHHFIPSYRFGPASLHEARVPRLCPVGPGMVLIRHPTLAAIGLLAEDLPGLELVDYCLRAFAAGLECVYEPSAIGTRNASYFPRKLEDGEKVRALAIEKALLARHDQLARWVAPVKA